MSETLKNIAKSFIGESVAASKYMLFAEIAEKEGFTEAEKAFIKTAEQEKTHAKIHYKLLNQLAGKEGFKELKVEVKLPTDLGSTFKNIDMAVNGEVYEFKEMYPYFAKTAKDEGYTDIAVKFLALARAEEGHAEKYKALLRKLRDRE